MRLTRSGLFKGMVISVLTGVILVIALRSLGVIGAEEAVTPETLSRQAYQALDAVRRRQPGDRRPASYDKVLTPLDAMLRQARSVLHGESYDPVADFESIHAWSTPVIEIAAIADAQARHETGFLSKEYRFNDQRAEASLYLASALWEKMNHNRPRAQNSLDNAQPYSAAEMNRLRQILDNGVEADPDNRDLRYLRGVVNRAEGLFAAAVRDLEGVIQLDPGFSAAWNTLGLVNIALREFEAAERALTKARDLALDEARRNQSPLGEDYAAVIYNLATFHDSLASFYAREMRLEPTVETRRLLDHHVGEARQHWEEFLRYEPSGSPDAALAREKLAALAM